MGLIQRPSYTLQISAAIHAAPAASTNYYITCNQAAPGVNASIGRIYVPMQSTLQRVVLNALCATPGSAETGTISLRVNNTTDYVVTTAIQWDAVVNGGFNTVSPLVPDELEVTDFIEIKITTPAWAIPPLNVLYQGIVLFATDL